MPPNCRKTQTGELQTLIIIATFIYFIFIPNSSFAAFGTLGRDQCAYPTSGFPVSVGDSSQASRMRASELDDSRKEIEATILSLNTDLAAFNGEDHLVNEASDCLKPRSSAESAQSCLQTYAIYRHLVLKKAEMSTVLAALNSQINSFQNPHRPQREVANFEELDTASISLSVINQYAIVHAETDLRYRSQVHQPLYRSPRTPDTTALNTPFYGPNYGYPFSYQKNYGIQAPALAIGSFACSTGVFGTGDGIALALFDPERLQFSRVVSSEGMGHSADLATALSQVYHNRIPTIPGYRMGALNVPYQVGGIYGVRSPYRSTIKRAPSSLVSLAREDQNYESDQMSYKSRWLGPVESPSPFGNFSSKFSDLFKNNSSSSLPSIEVADQKSMSAPRRFVDGSPGFADNYDK